MAKYITGIVQNNKHKLLSIGSNHDHIHIFFEYNVNQLVPDLVEEIKTSSNLWIKQQGLSKFKFDWQKGYGAFTHSRSQINQVVRYINNQESHHQNTSFKQEYTEILVKNGIEYKNDYMFEFFENVKP